MRVLFFDTETSDFPERGGRLVQFAARVMDFAFDPPLVCQEFSTLVKCRAEISEAAHALHGITREMTQSGITPQEVCLWLERQVHECAVVVAHNIAFDARVMQGEFYLSELDELEPDETFCTMQASRSVCQIATSGNGFKAPKLSEALRMLCGKELDAAHDALADTRACSEIFIELVKRGIVPEITQGRASE